MSDRHIYRLAPEWYDRSRQQRCNICGRFARWSETARQWQLDCVWWDAEEWWEHD